MSRTRGVGHRGKVRGFIAASAVAGLTFIGLTPLTALAGVVGTSTIDYHPVTGAVIVTADSGLSTANVVSLSGDLESGAIVVTDSAGWLVPVDAQCLASSSIAVCTPGVGDTAIGAVTVNLDDGADTFTTDGSVGSSFTINGGDGVDSLTGSTADETLNGNLGADTVNGAGGADTVNGDTFGSLLGGNDTVSGGTGNDTVSAQGGNDTLNGGGGDDTLNGGGSNDVMDGGLGADTFTGNTGSDRADYSSRTAAVTVTIGSGAGDDGEALEGDTVNSDVENVTTGTGADSVTGNTGNNVIKLGQGADSAGGGAGNDYLYGNDGADSLTGGAGTDSVYGAAGADTVLLVDSTRDYGYCGAGTDSYRRDGSTTDVLDACEVNLAAA